MKDISPERVGPCRLSSISPLKGYLDGAVLTDQGLLPVPRFVTDPGDVLGCAT
jgi:hypothetical protein